MLKMLGQAGTGYQNVVKVDKHEGETTEHTVHKPLEGLRRVFEAEGHPQKLKKSEGCNDRCLRNVGLIHRDLVVAPD